jgi:hypothetical protein
MVLYDWTLLPKSFIYLFPFFLASVDLIPVYYYSSFWVCPGFAFSVYYTFYCLKFVVVFYGNFGYLKFFFFLFTVIF